MITDLWHSLTVIEQLYWGIALLATFFFILLIIMAFVGADGDVEMEVDDMDAGFSIFSVRSIVAFFTFFGWGGIAGISAGLGAPQVAMFAFLIGFLAMVAVAYLFHQLLGLQESGNIDPHSAIGKIAEVYLTIPANRTGRGKIHVEMSGKTMEFGAVTEGEELVTGMRVQVVSVNRENLMTVKDYATVEP